MIAPNLLNDNQSAAQLIPRFTTPEILFEVFGEGAWRREQHYITVSPAEQDHIFDDARATTGDPGVANQ